jgi:hypothetical protein
MKKLFAGLMVAVVVALGLGAMLLAGSSAGAQTGDCYTGCSRGATTTTVVSTTTVTVSEQSATVQAETATATPASVEAATATKSDSLAFTGGDIAGMVLIALVFLGGGVLIVRLGRRNGTA